MRKKMSKEANVGELEHLCGMPSEGLGPHPFMWYSRRVSLNHALFSLSSLLFPFLLWGQSLKPFTKELFKCPRDPLYFD